jgi:hypothetical protein
MLWLLYPQPGLLAHPSTVRAQIGTYQQGRVIKVG